MAPSTRAPRRLPARVYWFRRALVIGTALALVFAIAHVIGGTDTGAGAARANVTAAHPKPTALATRPIGPLPSGTTTGAAGVAAGALVAPSGACSPSDITVTPVAGTAIAGSAIPLTLQLSGIQPACTFGLTAKSIVAKVSTANGKLWSTQDCPTAVTPASVVVRSAVPTTIRIWWSGRGSDSTCSRSTDWALPGTYQVVAAAIGSEPSSDVTVTLTQPARRIVIKTVRPKAKKSSTPATPNTGH